MKLLMVTLLVAYAAAVMATQSTGKATLDQRQGEEVPITIRYAANAKGFLAQEGNKPQSLPDDVQKAFDYINALKPKQTK